MNCAASEMDIAAARERMGKSSEVRMFGTGPREREKAMPYLIDRGR